MNFVKEVKFSTSQFADKSLFIRYFASSRVLSSSSIRFIQISSLQLLGRIEASKRQQKIYSADHKQKACQTVMSFFQVVPAFLPRTAEDLKVCALLYLGLAELFQKLLLYAFGMTTRERRLVEFLQIYDLPTFLFSLGMIKDSEQAVSLRELFDFLEAESLFYFPSLCKATSLSLASNSSKLMIFPMLTLSNSRF